MFKKSLVFFVLISSLNLYANEITTLNCAEYNPAGGPVSVESLTVQLDKPIHPFKDYNIHRLAGDISLKVSQHYMDAMGLENSTYLWQKVGFSKEPAAFSHQLESRRQNLKIMLWPSVAEDGKVYYAGELNIIDGPINIWLPMAGGEYRFYCSVY